MGKDAGTSRLTGRAAGLLVALALTAPAIAGAAIVPDVSDAPAGAQAIEALPAKSTELVERPGDHDWYSISGRNADDSVNAVFVRVLGATPSCSAPQALKIGLFNPEGRWMRTARAGAGDVATVLVPGNPSRYRLDVTPIDPGCTGLEYEVTYVATDPPTPDSKASLCLVARAKRIDAQDRLESLRIRRRTLSPAAQKRYDDYIAKAARAVSRARGSEKRVCS